MGRSKKSDQNDTTFETDTADRLGEQLSVFGKSMTAIQEKHKAPEFPGPFNQDNGQLAIALRRCPLYTFAQSCKPPKGNN